MGIAAFLSGIIGAMGLGGGGVLILFLVLFMDMPQLQAQGINLVFFIPIAAVSLVIHSKNKLVKWKLALPMIITGVIGILLGIFLLDKLPTNILRYCFAGLILIIGIRELWTAIAEIIKRKKRKSSDT